MLRQGLLFLCAVQFLTRIPTPPLPGFRSDWITRSARYFPLVGQIVGLAAAAAWLGAGAFLPPSVAAICAMGVAALVTGGFHEDGLADTADGLGGGQHPAQRLAIMKDSRIGTYGALALGLVLALRVAALATLPPELGALALLAGHGLARSASVCAMKLMRYVGDPEAAKWKPAPLAPAKWEVALALAIGVWPLVLLSPASAMGGVCAGAFAASLLALAARRLIGGYTGDVLGGVEQMFETFFLVGLLASLRT